MRIRAERTKQAASRQTIEKLSVRAVVGSPSFQSARAQPDRPSQGVRGSQIEPARASQGDQASQIEPTKASQGAR